MQKTLYSILGVAETATDVELRRAYEAKLAALGPDDAMLQTALKEAWSTLSNPERRARYDAKLTAARQQEQAVVYEERPASSRLGVYVVVAALVLGGGWYALHKRNVPQPQVVAAQPVVVEAKGTVPAIPAQTSGQAAVAPAGRVLTPETLFAQASASVVRVNNLGAGGQMRGLGSGVVIGPGRVITNCHVTRGASSLRVKLGNSQYDASVELADERHDLCRLAVSGLSAPSVAIGSSSSLHVGQKVYAIGSPQGLDLTISDGMISQMRAGQDGAILQTTAPVSPGSSGGGLFDEYGALIGIVTFQVSTGQNLNFAIPADWINSMSASTGGNAAISTVAGRNDGDGAGASQPSLVGSWRCYAPLTGRGMELTFEANGIFTGAADHRPFGGRYYMQGKQLFLGSNLVVQVDELTPSRMVLIDQEGVRLVCNH